MADELYDRVFIKPDERVAARLLTLGVLKESTVEALINGVGLEALQAAQRHDTETLSHMMELLMSGARLELQYHALVMRNPPMPAGIEQEPIEQVAYLDRGSAESKAQTLLLLSDLGLVNQVVEGSIVDGTGASSTGD